VGNFIDYSFILATDRQKQESPPGLDFYNGYVAWVGDNSFFGLTSPLKGYRFRVSAEKFFSGYNFSSITLDYRRYFRLRPFTIAVRGTHIGRFPGYFQIFENSGELESIPMFLAQPWFIRGWSELSSTDLSSRYGIQVDQLGGSKLLFGGAEIRIPFTGPERLALIPSSFLFTDLNLFLDSGIAFREYEQLTDPNRGWPYPDPEWITSAGISLRVNVFNAIILEPYYAWPLRENSKAVFGLNFWPGW
jgi:outer membrane protein assembly factor BamA